MKRAGRFFKPLSFNIVAVVSFFVTSEFCYAKHHPLPRESDLIPRLVSDKIFSFVLCVQNNREIYIGSGNYMLCGIESRRDVFQCIRNYTYLSLYKVDADRFPDRTMYALSLNCLGGGGGSIGYEKMNIKGSQWKLTIDPGTP